ncbi:hypothetical protein [Sphingomonas sp. RT2P30]|uniref:hypothetical protein n=1 Tax=Parasphingomonas halimpatiens TaxID=3096162 RepID=UPI002FCABDF7
MPKQIDREYFASRAVKARAMAELATTPAARSIHLELAADYDQRAANFTAEEEPAPGGGSAD